MKVLSSKVIFVTIFVLFVSIIQASEKTAVSSSNQFMDSITAEEAEIFKLTNGKRRKRGLKLLKVNMQLVCLARKQSANMARHRQLSHSVNGKSLAYRIKKSGYPYRHVGENVARSKGTPHHIVRMWMKSQGHRVNILNPHFREIGIGIATAENGDKYYTQVYGTQLKARRK